MEKESFVLKTDAYKYSHAKQLPPKTTKIYSYAESRGGKFDNTVFYGLQYILKAHFEGVVITKEDVEYGKKFVDKYMRPDLFEYDGFMRIATVHGGKLPIRIKAVPEGTVVGTKNVLMTVECLDDELPWLTNFCESLLLHIWYPTTVATLSREIKKVLVKYLKETTAYTTEEILGMSDYKLVDFGYRGASCDEAARIGGSGHLVNFKTSDNMRAAQLILRYYNDLVDGCDDINKMPAGSIAASEHSTITSWGAVNEGKAYYNFLMQFPNEPAACVSDSTDVIRACKEEWGGKLKEIVMQRSAANPLIVRGDSGDPVQTVKKIFWTLWEQFGGTINDKGFKVLHPSVRVIQGDGINYESIIDLLNMLVEEGFSTENLTFGMGGALLQKVDRDTQNFAFKCSYTVNENGEVDVRKSPIEINAQGERVQSFKKSKAGHLKLIFDPITGKHSTVEHASDEEGDVMVPVFENGVILKEWTFEEIRERAKLVA